MVADIRAARAAGLAGVVLGVQDQSGGLDMAVMQRLMAEAAGMGSTLHRVIDVVPEPLVALDQAIELGFERVLTSGAEPFAPKGVGLIRAMVVRAAGRISVMPGCGLTAENVGAVVAATGVHEVHASCAEPVAGDPAFSDFDPVGGRVETVERVVRGMVEALG